MDSFNRAIHVCEEFSEHIYSDIERGTILLNVDREWFSFLSDRLFPLGYKLLHKTSMENSITCVFMDKMSVKRFK